MSYAIRPKISAKLPICAIGLVRSSSENTPDKGSGREGEACSPSTLFIFVLKQYHANLLLDCWFKEVDYCGF